VADARNKPDPAAFGEMIERKVERKLAAQGKRHGAIWAGLGMSGMIGWAVVVPTVAGTMLGAYLDRRFPSEHSWTLSLLALGLVVGCLQAWHWVSQADRSMHETASPGDE
jgi:ATP synthase protein I